MKQQNKRDQSFIDAIEPRKERKARAAVEGAAAAKEYARQAQSTLDRMAKLRAERLARSNSEEA
jgi:hypothetical protein